MRKYGNFGNKTRRSGQNPKTLLPFSIFDLHFSFMAFSSEKNHATVFTPGPNQSLCCCFFFLFNNKHNIKIGSFSSLFPVIFEFGPRNQMDVSVGYRAILFFSFSCAHQLHVKIVKRLPEKNEKRKEFLAQEQVWETVQREAGRFFSHNIFI